MLLTQWTRNRTVWCIAVILAAATAMAQDDDPPANPRQEGRFELKREMPGPNYRPPTFVVPPGGPTNGAIIMQPPIPPGPMIWQQGDEGPEVIRPSDHWIGVQCGRMIPALRAQLGLEEDQGILVEEVVEESPAAKAGIEKHDVLLQAGKRKLTKVQDLIDEVDAVEEGKLSIELVRKGEKKTVELVPEKRPPIETPDADSPESPAEEWQNFFDYMQKWEPGKDGRPSMKLQFWRQPGSILPNPPGPEAKLPNNVKIKILKQGDKPADIEVTRGDETWNVTENELEKLPNDLRPHVERQLGRHPGPGGPWNVLPKEWKVPNPLDREDIERRFEELSRRIEQLPNPLEREEGAIEKRFDEMNRRLDKLRDAIEQLRAKRGGKSADEPADEPKPEPENDEAKDAVPQVQPSPSSMTVLRIELAGASIA